jgi:hypothetical protein
VKVKKWQYTEPDAVDNKVEDEHWRHDDFPEAL